MDPRVSEFITRDPCVDYIYTKHWVYHLGFDLVIYFAAMSSTRDIKEWYKLAFRLLVSEKWDVIADRVENGDQTCRWLKELLIQKLRMIERGAWQTGLAATAFTIKERLQPLKGYIISQEDFLKAQHWLKFPKGLLVIRDKDFTPSQRVLGGRLALLESFLKHHDDSTAAGGAICQIFNSLVDIEEVVNAIYEKADPKLASNVKVT